MDSLLSKVKSCYLCGRPTTEKHHVFFGTANRKKSEKWGCWVYLCPEHHRLGKNAVHLNSRVDKLLKVLTQEAFEEKHGIEKFMEVFKKNYKED